MICREERRPGPFTFPPPIEDGKRGAPLLSKRLQRLASTLASRSEGAKHSHGLSGGDWGVRRAEVGGGRWEGERSESSPWP